MRECARQVWQQRARVHSPPRKQIFRSSENEGTKPQTNGSTTTGDGHELRKVGSAETVAYRNTHSDERKGVKHTIEDTNQPGVARRSDQVNARLEFGSIARRLERRCMR
jgi:hypothetical protein